MHASRIFWGIVVLLAGLLLLASNMGFLPGNFWGFIWPFFLVAGGLWFLLMPSLTRGEKFDVETYSLPLEGAASARINLHHGAGKLMVTGSDTPGLLLDGTFAGGIESKVNRTAEITRVQLESKIHIMAGWPVVSSGGLAWNLRLTKAIPVDLEVESGASETVMDLTGINLVKLKIETGASSTRVILPSNSGLTMVEVSAGAASLEFTIPQDVSARIHFESALVGKTIDTNRFPQTGDYYQSTGYDQAVNRVEMKIETGVGSISIK